MKLSRKEEGLMRLSGEMHVEARTPAFPEKGTAGARNVPVALPGGGCSFCCGTRSVRARA
jgi:hypothetical protein